jgi:cytoskeleton protein RodZ
MKTVGKQLQEARLARNWTPELAARETKIKVNRLRDLEADDYTHFTSPAYARGFVRTYARALGLDEYKILRQLDNKLPEDDNASFTTDSGLPYIPESSRPARDRSAGRSAGLYVVMLLGCGVFLTIAFVLFQAYRAGELQRYFAGAPASETNPAVTNVAPNTAGTETAARALPLDPNASTNAAPAVQAQPVNAATETASTANTNAAPDAATNTPPAVKAVAVDPSDATGVPPSAAGENSTNTTSVDNAATTNIPRAQAVDPSELTNAPPAIPSTPVAASARASGSAHTAPPAPPPASQAAVAAPEGKRLVLTASRDSFIKVTAIDAPDMQRGLYSGLLRAGESASFDGHKFSINVAVPAAVDISLDGVNYGPHSDQEAPETFIVESHQP